MRKCHPAGRSGDPVRRRAVLRLLGGLVPLSCLAVPPRSDALIVSGYRSEDDNRFVAWDRDLRPNLSCRLADWLHPAIGWDSRGRGFVMIDEHHFIAGHNGAPQTLWFNIPGSRIVHRTAGQTKAVRVSSPSSGKGDREIVVGRLDEGLGGFLGFEPLPVMVPRTPDAYEGIEVVVFGPAGRMGTQTLAGVQIQRVDRVVGKAKKADDGSILEAAKTVEDIDVLAVSDVRRRPAGTGLLASGDSGSAVVGRTSTGKLGLIGPALGYAPGGQGPDQAEWNFSGLVAGTLETLKEKGIAFRSVAA